MGISVPKVPTTADDLDSLPDDGNRYEIIDGALLVTPAPSLFHQPYAKPLDLEVLVAPTDVRASARTQVEPDLFVMPWLRGADRSTRWVAMHGLVLAVEILSPSTQGIDRGVKRTLYVEQGVPEYWIVDVDARAIEVWRADDPAPRVSVDTMSWQPVQVHPALRIDVGAVFAEVFRAA
jgi:Uma2 family endonuclease